MRGSSTSTLARFSRVRIVRGEMFSNGASDDAAIASGSGTGT